MIRLDIASAFRWIRRFGHRVPALAVEAAGVGRKQGLSGVHEWWRKKVQGFDDWREEQEGQLAYAEWLAGRQGERARLGPGRAEEGVFSILTSVYDTPPDLLDLAARSVLEQTYGAFEWILVDNGSTREETRRTLSRIAADPRVRAIREEENRGPLGGMRRALEEARGAFVVPFDSDDLLYADALATLAHVIQRERPSLLYSDEDVLNGGAREPFFRAGWDPAQVIGNSYIFHLCALERSKALEIGVYADVGANWCHDWDTVLRVLRAGVPVRHVPEVLYSWRVHEKSSTNRVEPDRRPSLASQKHVLETHLASSDLADRFSVEPSPIDRGAPEYHLRRLPTKPRPLLLCRLDAKEPLEAPKEYPVETVAIARDDVAGLVAVARRALADPRAPWLALVSDRVVPEGEDWLFEALGLRELVPDCAVVGGRIVDERGLVLEGASYFGFAGLLGSPERGHHRRDPGPFGMFLKQRSASAVTAEFCFVDPALLVSAAFDPLPTPELLGGWIGAAAARSDRRVVYTPFMTATARSDSRRRDPDRASIAAFLERFSDLVPETRYYSPHAGLDQERAYRLVRPSERERSLRAIRAGASAP